jgi:hypothetical protein
MIGETVRRELFGSSPALGESLRVKLISCEIIAVLGSKGQGSFGNDQDDLVFIPIKTLQRRITGNTQVNDLLVSMADGSDTERVKASMTQLLRERRKLADTDEDNFNVLDTKQLADTLSGTTKVMTTLLGAVAAVSLLVGGIGIMNIMLVSVTERTARSAAPGHRRAGARGAAAVPDRGRGACRAGRGDRHRAGHRCLDRSFGFDECALRVQPRGQPAELRLLGRHRRAVRLLPGPPGSTAEPDRCAAA